MKQSMPIINFTEHTKLDQSKVNLILYCLFLFFCLGFYWWLINALDVCLKVVFNFRPSTGSKQMKIKEIIYLSLGWGLGIISTIVNKKI
jgi:hypothetical protein